MLFLLPKSRNCILRRILEILASSRLLRTSSLSTVFPVPYHLSTVHLVLTAKCPAPGVVASKPHVQERHSGRPGGTRVDPSRAACAGLRSDAGSIGAS